jgi:hypothetical protein
MEENEKVVMEGAEIRLRNRRVALLRSRERHPVYGGSVWKMRFKFLNLAGPYRAENIVAQEANIRRGRLGLFNVPDEIEDRAHFGALPREGDGE